MKLIRYNDYYNLMKTLVKKPIIIILNIEMNLNEFKFSPTFMKWARDLFPLCRSLTGEGNRKTLKYIKSFKPRYHEYNRFLIYRKKSDIIWDQNFNDYFQNYQIDEHNELIRVK